MRVTIDIIRRPQIADPQGATIRRALHELGHANVKALRVDRSLHLELDGDDPTQVRSQVEQMCRSLLANPALEDFEIRLEG